MQFAIVAHDQPNALAQRLAVRPDHLKHIESLGAKMLLAGPFLDAKGDMCGSLIVIEAADLAEAEAICARDPYVTEGLFATYTVTPFRLSINNTAK
ncbi:MAG: YciI family protein [Devosia sp.]